MAPASAAPPISQLAPQKSRAASPAGARRSPSLSQCPIHTTGCSLFGSSPIAASTASATSRPRQRDGNMAFISLIERPYIVLSQTSNPRPLILDTFLRADTLDAIWVLDLAHLSHQIGKRDQLLGRVTAGDDQV